jgi:hypothetical protein
MFFLVNRRRMCINTSIQCQTREVRYYLFVLLFLLPRYHLNAQQHVVLAERHVKKINNEEVAQKKLKLYSRYYKKDSIKIARLQERYWKKQTDSLAEAMVSREQALRKKEAGFKDGVNSKMYKALYTPWAKKQAADFIKKYDATHFQGSPYFRLMLRNYLEWYFLNATQNDSLLHALKEHVPGLDLPKPLQEKLSVYRTIKGEQLGKVKGTLMAKSNRLKGANKAKTWGKRRQEYYSKINKYNPHIKALQNAETMQAFAKAEGSKRVGQYLSGKGELSNIHAVKSEIGEASKLQGYANELQQLQDSTYLKEQAQKRAQEAAVRYLAENPQLLDGVQAKMNKLMKKYSVVPNSNDLSTATKRSSFKGRAFTERLQVATNFQLVSIDPLSIDFAPQVGYKINRYFVAGAGALYRKTFKEALPSLAPEVIGYRGFLSYDVVKNLFAYGEYGRNSPGFKTVETKVVRLWEGTLLVGAGRKFSMGTRLESTLMVGYNFLHEKGNTVFPRPWIIRICFQTSELAMMKRR